MTTDDAKAIYDDITEAEQAIIEARAQRNRAAARFREAIRARMEAHKLSPADILGRLPAWKRHRWTNFMHLGYILTPEEAADLLEATSRKVGEPK